MRLLRVRVQSVRRAFVRALPLPPVRSAVRVRLSALRQLLRVRVRRHRVRRQRVRLSRLFVLLPLLLTMVLCARSPPRARKTRTPGAGFS